MAAPEAGPLRMMATLGLAGMCSGLALVGIFLLTLPRIERNRAEALDLISQLDVPREAGEDRDVKSYPLQFAEIGSVVQAINTRISRDAVAVMSERCRIARSLREMAFKLTTGR